MTQQPAIERRATPRLRVFFGAWIPGGGSAPAIECQVRTFSGAGARLAPSTRRRLPDAFDLRVDHHKRTYHAAIVWRAAGEVGVRFLARPEISPPAFDSKSLEKSRLTPTALRERFTLVSRD
jgi:hypothetical protein